MKGDYSNEEIFRKIDQLHGRLEDIIKTNEIFAEDWYLHQWLIQNSFKVDQAETAIRESVQWRKENDIDALADQDWGFGVAGLARDFPVSSGGFSKTGQPIMEVNGEGIDFRTMIKKYGKDTLLRYNVQLYVKIEKLLIESYRRKLSSDIYGRLNFDSNLIEQNQNCAPIIIANYKNLSMWNATSLDVMWVLMEGAKIGMKYFPCLVSSVNVVNTNKFSALLFKTIKPIFAMSPYFNVDCYDTDKAKWSKVMLERIDASQLTAQFGGCKKE